MANISILEKYLDYEFSSGVYAGEDYITFQTKYISYLRIICKANGWELINIGRNHYCFSAFIKCRDKFVYLSISDVRGINNKWYHHILIRKAESEKDYRGDWNNYTTLPELQVSIAKLLGGAA